jgi:hypothetical protein
MSCALQKFSCISRKCNSNSENPYKISLKVYRIILIFPSKCFYYEHNLGSSPLNCSMKGRIMAMMPRKATMVDYRVVFSGVIHKLRIYFLATLVMLVIFFIVRIVNQSSLIFDQLLLCGFVTLLLLFIGRRYGKNKLLSNFEIFLLVVSITFASQSVFLNIDRSRSFYVLSWIQNNHLTYVNGEIDLSRVESQEKANESAIRDRINEQLIRGYLIKSQSGVQLSKRGLLVLTVSNHLAEFFNLKGWFENYK